MQFDKYHALGNDYLVLDPVHGTLPPPEGVIRVCHRHFGLGSDGILYGPLVSDAADVGLQIWNPDGSEAEKSGNGLRIFSRYLHDVGTVGDQPFTVETAGGVVTCQVHDRTGIIEVGMGRVSFHSDDIPVTGPPREVLDEELVLGGHHFRYYAATIGNPHVVVPVDQPTRELACTLGPLIENHTDLFPNRTNVQFLSVLDRHHIRIEIWERGAGYTLASGSSSSAAAAVARKMGACDQEVLVQCPGGAIGIRMDETYGVTMTGPATRVGAFDMDPGVLTQELPSS